MNYTLPESLKRENDCKFRGPHSECCNARNYLRRYNAVYCVAKLDQWVRHKRPRLEDKEVVTIVSLLAETAN